MISAREWHMHTYIGPCTTQTLTYKLVKDVEVTLSFSLSLYLCRAHHNFRFHPILVRSFTRRCHHRSPLNSHKPRHPFPRWMERVYTFMYLLAVGSPAIPFVFSQYSFSPLPSPLHARVCVCLYRSSETHFPILFCISSWTVGRCKTNK